MELVSPSTSDDRIRDAIGGFVKRAQQDIDAHAPRLTADLASALKAERQIWRDEHITAFTRLAAAIKQLDEASSLSAVLKVLSAGVMNEAARVALLLVEPERLVVWGHFGFGETPAPAEMTLGRKGPFDAAIDTREAVSIARSDDDSRPAFMRLPPGHAALVMPIVVGENVVALLYADGLERNPDSTDAPVWTELVEVLVRHASLRLENVTTLRTVEVLTRTA
jgi:transcriptional regulator with GAF, ATPase, and Fis domain